MGFSISWDAAIIRRGSVFLSALWSALFALSASAATDAKVLDISATGLVSDWIMDEPSGRIFASIYDGGKVVEFDSTTGKLVREIPLADKPRQLLIKGGKLVATVEAGVSVYIIDLKTSAVEARLQLAGRGPNGLFSSKADNPYVYASCMGGENMHGSEVFQIDLTQKKVVKSQPANWNHGYVSNVAFSADGQMVVVDGRRAGVSPSGAALMKFDESTCSAVEVFRHHNSFGVIRADPYSRHWSFGGDLYGQDIKSRVRQFRGYVIGFHPTADLVVGYGAANNRGFGQGGEERLITFQTYSTAELLREVSLGRTPAKNRNGGDDNYGNWVGDPVLQFDAKNARLFVGHRGMANVVDLKSLGLTIKPLVMIDAPSSVSVDLGQPMKLPLKLRDPALTAGTTFSLATGPKQMKLDAGNILSWTPTSEDVGEQQVSIKADRQGSSDTLNLTVTVRRPSVDLGGTIRNLVVDSAGARALAYISLPKDPKQRGGGYDPMETRSPGELVLVDLKTLKVTARRRIDEPLAGMAITSSLICIAPQNVARIQKLKMTDLSDEGRTFTNGNTTRIDPLPWGSVAVYSQNGVQQYDGQTLTNAAWIANDNNFGYDPYGGRSQGISQTNGGTVLGSVVLDSKTNLMRMLRASGGLPAVVSDPMANQYRGDGVRNPDLWGRHVLGQQLMGTGNTVITQIPNGQSMLLESFPAVMTLSNSAEGANQRTRVLRLDFRDLIEGTRLEPLTLSQTTAEGYYNNGMESAGRMFERGGKLLVGSGDRLYSVDIPAERLKALAKPLHFIQRLEPLVSPVKDRITIKTEADGGKGNRTFELPGSPNGTSIDPKTGVITVDTAIVWKQHVEKLGSAQPMYRGPTTAPATEQFDQARAIYKRMIGRDAGNTVPIAVHLRAVVKDEENQKAELSGYIILLGPTQDATAALARAAASDPTAAARRTPAGRLPTTQPSEFPDDEVQALRTRILELERRNQQLEAQLDLMKDLIRGNTRGPATRPQ